MIRNIRVKTKNRRELIINKLMTMRIEGASQNTMMNYVLNETYIKTVANAKVVIKTAMDRLVELSAAEFETALADGITRLENLYETTLDNKTRLSILQEINKIRGLYMNKLDVTTGGKEINEIVISIVNANQHTSDNGI